eukprot:3199261-Pyramimonas_sp.AAC.1
MHGLTTLPPGEIDVLGVRTDDIAILEQTHLIKQWRSFLNPDASHDTVVDEEHGGLVITIDRDERAAKPMPLFFRACQGHSCFAHSIERMYAPYGLGMARCHGHLMHVTPLVQSSQRWEKVSSSPRTSSVDCAKHLTTDFSG